MLSQTVANRDTSLLEVKPIFVKQIKLGVGNLPPVKVCIHLSSFSEEKDKLLIHILLVSLCSVLIIHAFIHRRTTPPKIHEDIRSLINTGLDSMENQKLPSQHSMLGHHLLASASTRQRFAGGLMKARLQWSLNLMYKF